MNRNPLSCVIILLIAAAGAGMKAQQPPPKGHYKSIGVSQFTAEQGAKIPPDFLVAIANELTEQLRKTKKFELVFLEASNPARVPEPALVLTGIVSEYRAGSRAMRYLVGFGAGKTKVVADVKLTDRKTGQVVLEDKVDGKVVIGVLGGDSMGAAKGLAKEVAKVAKKNLFP